MRRTLLDLRGRRRRAVLGVLRRLRCRRLLGRRQLRILLGLGVLRIALLLVLRGRRALGESVGFQGS